MRRGKVLSSVRDIRISRSRQDRTGSTFRGKEIVAVGTVGMPRSVIVGREVRNGSGRWLRGRAQAKNQGAGADKTVKSTASRLGKYVEHFLPLVPLMNTVLSEHDLVSNYRAGLPP